MINETDLEAWGYWSEEFLPEPTPTTMTLVEDFQNTSGQKPTVALYNKLIVEEYQEWVEANSDLEELKEMADLVYVIYGLALAKGWDLDEAIRRVHENNIGRMLQPDGTIKRREDGKIMKNKSYPKVDLGSLV